jgi:hypothetical protein
MALSGVAETDLISLREVVASHFAVDKDLRKSCKCCGRDIFGGRMLIGEAPLALAISFKRWETSFVGGKAKVVKSSVNVDFATAGGVVDLGDYCYFSAAQMEAAKRASATFRNGRLVLEYRTVSALYHVGDEADVGHYSADMVRSSADRLLFYR